ncbi:HAD family phosphatase [Pacificibacter sp. AS14]|uniref:HAD family hydrolase n=1 Tax=Pacificibacter sp. AS14 TaxID=3135785 RepID=UPI003176FB24
MKQPKLVIFDCDGVLVDSEPPTLELLRDELEHHGLKLTMAQVDADYMGVAMADIAKKARANGAALPDGWVDEIYAKMFEKLKKGVPLIAGIESALDALDAAGIPYAVGSNGPMEKMDITLGAHPALFERLKGRIFSAHDCKAGKPDPELFLKAAAVMGVEPKDCVVVDDSVAGATAGLRAGMRTLGFDPHGEGAHLKTIGAEHLAHMNDLSLFLNL